ncbi:DUF418 domain-containing protein [Massilia sp. YIM B02763]|uniref:DUF418 domain-containing protein n=1 Tax=Massilia sp. YIM B02763 TaxID=3050130 RepID=UPI0025B69B4F|nr:DUF418 domain-containing protein [Massilia sp. YIM B02763]MDN4055315.1 DUF418 domain-containing protein [Massilia sp. YIM B02763]
MHQPSAVSPAPHTGSTLSASTGRARIQSLDVIRGVSILGILAVNADGFAVPMEAAMNPLTWPFPNEGWTALSYWLMDAFFHEKFVTLFSMLFGMSLFLVGGERTDKERGRILRRRLVFLFLFGMLHGFGIWWGDILSLYAAAGAIMFFCRSWKPRTLLVAGIALFVALPLARLPVGALPGASPQARAEASAHLVPSPRAIERRKAAAAATLEEARGSWTGAWRVNTRQYLRLLSGYPSIIPSTLGLMMIGLSLFKSGFFTGRSSTRRYAATIAAGACAAAVIAWLCWRKDVIGMPVLGGHTAEELLAPLVSLAYASVLILLLRAGAGRVLAPFAAAGRMAFTNYLTQSIVMTSIFYGGRGALMGQVDRPALFAIVGAVWVLQLCWSTLWFSRFGTGPFEWVWRCLTLGRRVPLAT